MQSLCREYGERWVKSTFGRFHLLNSPRPWLVANRFLQMNSRTGRFVAESDRVRFMACRAALRRILAGLLDADPAEIKFQYSEFGKPSLIGEHSRGFHFNVSHSDNIAMIAVTSQSQIGVDVERVRPDIDATGIAERFFSAVEREMLASLPGELQVEAFFRCWTRKEATIKAIGEGLSFPLDQFDVSLAPMSPRNCSRFEASQSRSIVGRCMICRRRRAISPRWRQRDESTGSCCDPISFEFEFRVRHLDREPAFRNRHLHCPEHALTN